MKKSVVLLFTFVFITGIFLSSLNAQLSGEVIYCWTSKKGVNKEYKHYDTLRFDGAQIVYITNHPTFEWKTVEGYTFYNQAQNRIDYINWGNKMVKRKEYDFRKRQFKFYEQPIMEYDWVLHDEYKQIDKYKTQKATAKYETPSGEFQFTAWFTTEIPVFVSLRALSGLPGLILELRENATGLYTFQSIEMKPVGNLQPDPSMIFTPVENNDKSAEKKRKLLETLNKDGN
jgi:GLPGLI family protein